MLVVSTVVAHDFWLSPHFGAFTADSAAVNGKSGAPFPDSSAVQPARVTEAWRLNGSTETKISDLSDGSSNEFEVARSTFVPSVTAADPRVG